MERQTTVNEFAVSRHDKRTHYILVRNCRKKEKDGYIPIHADGVSNEELQRKIEEGLGIGDKESRQAVEERVEPENDG